MTIVYLAWGSLVWQPRALPFVPPWREGGPRLPLEFSRMSRDQRLTLVVDPAAGRSLPTRYAASVLTDLAVARAALAQREETAIDNIGFVVVGSKEQVSHVGQVAKDVRTWAECQHFGSVIWTDLPPKFSPGPFTVAAGREYLAGLDEAAASRAREYIEKAPPEVRTYLRAALEATGWVERRSYDESLYGLIMSMRTAGLTYEAVAEKLRQQAVPTPRGRTSWNKGNVWHYLHNVENLRLRY